MKRLAVAAGLLIAIPGLALAQGRPRTEPNESCAAVAAPPPEFAGWSQPQDLTAAASEAGLGRAALTPGKAFTAHFLPVGDVKFRVPPQKADGPQVYGGLYLLKIEQAGVYRMVAGAGPWMDLYQDKTAVTSIGHGHGAPCTGLGKYVDFPLKPGAYLVQLSESLTPQTEIMVAKVAQ